MKGKKSIENKNSVEVMRKKIVQIGPVFGTRFSTPWMKKNFLAKGSEIEIVQTNNYMLIKACSNPFMNDFYLQKLKN
jgi:hypothetical protein